MKLHIDSQGRILSVGPTKFPGLQEIEVPDDTFGSLSQAQILCYACTGGEGGIPSIRLLVSPELLVQIGLWDQQRKADQEEITALQMALTEQYEADLARDEDLTNTQMALAELYEGLEVV